MMKILYILRHNPWGIGGGCYACRCYLDAFTSAFEDAQFDVCICKEYLQEAATKDFPNVRFIPVKERGEISRLFIPFSKIMHRHQKVVLSLLKQNHYDYCIFDDNCIAGSLVRLVKNTGCKTIVINHNCELEYFRDNLTGIRKRLLLPVVKYNEEISYKTCDYNIFLTKEDITTFSNLYGKTPAQSIIGGCFLRKQDKSVPNINNEFNREAPTFVISGTIGNIQNMDGINYFLDELYPLLPADVHIIITGKNAPQYLRDKIKGLGNIQIIENPKEILSVVCNCDIFLCPTRLGGGFKLRLMDGFRCGLPVIAHNVSSRGYSNFENIGYLHSYSTKEEFVSAMQNTIEQIRNRAFSKKEIQDFATNEFLLENAIERLRIIRT